MPNIAIPSQYRSGIEQISRLTEPELAELKATLEKALPDVIPANFVEKQAATIQSLSGNDASAVISALLWLVSGPSHLQLPLEEFTQSVSASQDLKLSEDEKEALANRLAELLSIGPLRLTWKVLDVLTEQDKSFIEVRVLTDLRPVFGDNPEETPDLVVITHALRIQYRTARRMEEIFISLDGADLQSLRKAVERAEIKATTLKASLQAAGLAYLDVGE